ncbi:MAG: hypothetical protein JWR68_717 [Polaromonas sp.]|nr:hypothetical protein [Polaromonas sp.]
MKKHTIGGLVSKLPLVLALGGFAMATAQTLSPVKAPPLPPGSEKVRVEAGVTVEEVDRQKRAHKHSRLEKKDPTRDDTLDALPSDPKDPKESKDPKDPKEPKAPKTK